MSRRRSPSASSLLSILAVVIVSIICAAESPGVQVTNLERGYRVAYPRGWKSQHTGRNTTVYNGEDLTGGMLYPAGGAIIVIQMFPPCDHPRFKCERGDETNLLDFARGGQIISQTPAGAGQRAKLTYLAPHLRETWTIRHVGDRTFLASASCNPDDPKATEYDAVLENVVSSITLLKATPGPAETPHYKAEPHVNTHQHQ